MKFGDLGKPRYRVAHSVHTEHKGCKAEKDKTDWRDYVSGFLLSFANPAYILVHVALIATVKSMGFYDADGNAFSNASMILGIFAGCSGWWFIIASIMKVVRKYFRPRHMLWINRISGIVITLIGVSLLISMISNLQIDTPQK